MLDVAFWAFQDLIQNGSNSPYRDWFDGIDFSQRSPLNDPFTYQPWEGALFIGQNSTPLIQHFANI